MLQCVAGCWMTAMLGARGNYEMTVCLVRMKAIKTIFAAHTPPKASTNLMPSFFCVKCSLNFSPSYALHFVLCLTKFMFITGKILRFRNLAE